MTFSVDVFTLVSESRVTGATCMPILDFLSLSVLDLGGPMYATDRQTSDSIIAYCVVDNSNAIIVSF